jgi:hypothetical protein
VLVRLGGAVIDSKVVWLMAVSLSCPPPQHCFECDTVVVQQFCMDAQAVLLKIEHESGPMRGRNVSTLPTHTIASACDAVVHRNALIP